MEILQIYFFSISLEAMGNGVVLRTSLSYFYWPLEWKPDIREVITFLYFVLWGGGLTDGHKNYKTKPFEGHANHIIYASLSNNIIIPYHKALNVLNYFG